MRTKWELHSKPNWTCFVHYLKIFQHFFGKKKKNNNNNNNNINNNNNKSTNGEAKMFEKSNIHYRMQMSWWKRTQCHSSTTLLCLKSMDWSIEILLSTTVFELLIKTFKILFW